MLYICSTNYRYRNISLASTRATKAPLSGSSHLTPSRPQVGQIIELTCKRLGVDGKGICLGNKDAAMDSFVFLCRHALPGEKMRARVTSVQSNHADAELVERLKRNDDWTDPICSSFGSCGGCTLQSMDYSAQLKSKQSLVEDMMKRGRIQSISRATFLPIVPSTSLYNYRNKVTIYWSSNSQGAPFLGMMVRGSREVIPIPHCHLGDDTCNALIRQVEASVASCHHGGGMLLPYTTASGIMSHVIVRCGTGREQDDLTETKEYLVILVTVEDEPQSLEPIVKALLASSLASSLAGVVNKVVSRSLREKEGSSEEAVKKPRGFWRAREDQEVMPVTTHILYGREYVTEHVCGLSFQVSAGSFAQVNTQQCAVLYGKIKEASGLKATDVLVDLYCGTGTIGLTLVNQVRSLIGVELSEVSVSCARSNAALNGINNSSFIAGDCNKVAKRWSEGIRAETNAMQSRIAFQSKEHIPRPDVVILDPSRGGATAGVIQYLNLCGCRRVIYVSCNPATAVRDIGALCGTEGIKGQPPQLSSPRFELRSVQSFDMFPQTDCVELLAVLDRIM